MRERRYFIALTIAGAILVLFGVASVILFSITLSKQGTGSDNIFEIVLFAFYFIVLVTSLVLSIKAIENGSFVIKAMMYQRNTENAISRTAKVLVIIFGSLAFLLFGYSFLSLFIPQIPTFNFPIVLIYTIVNFSLTVLVYSIFFYIYPNFKERKITYEKKN